MIPSDRTAFRIGDWRIEPALDAIVRDGVTAKLEPRRMRVLVCLAEHAGEVVSVEQLLDAVWQDVVVTHDSVYQAVAGLRRALGDDQRHPIYIANVQRRGYRLIAPLAPAEQGLVSAPPHNDSSAHVDAQGAQTPATHGARGAAAVLPRSVLMWIGATLMVIALLGALFWSIRWRQTQPAPSATPAGQTTAQRVTIPAGAFVPPSHSIAVLPFVNISGDKEQDYFSDGLTDELLNSLARINELQVTGRTSTFYFKGQHADLTTIARRLNVAAILEGSVRRSEHTVRVSAQLINAVSGYGLWSESYDRDLGDVLKVQTEIATAVASALRVTLLRDEAAKIELGGTRNPAAFDAYLRGLRLTRLAQDESGGRAAIEAYSEAIRLDPNYALAFAGRATALSAHEKYFTGRPGHDDEAARAHADAERAIALAPEMAEGHVALSQVLEWQFLDFAPAVGECRRALALAPGSPLVVRWCSALAADMGQFDTAIAGARRGIALDPLNPMTHLWLANALQKARRYEDSIPVYNQALTLEPPFLAPVYGQQGLSFYLLGNLSMAKSTCETMPQDWWNWVCLAVTLHKLGLRSEAEAQIPRLIEKGNRFSRSDSFAYQFAQIDAQWGNKERALDWLGKALRLHDSGLPNLKTDPLLDPLRKEPRFQAIERELNFPE